MINTSRGPVVDEAALAAALRARKIAGAGIDVTEVEPLDAEGPLLKVDNLLITPHFAGSSAVSSATGAQRWAENVALVLAGKPPHGLANPEVIRRSPSCARRNPLAGPACRNSGESPAADGGALSY